MSEVQTKQPARIGYYDRLRVLAMTAVILIHVCGSAATIYLLLPVFRLITRHAGRRMVGYLLLLWFVFSSLWRAAAGLFPALALQDYANLDILGGYAGYVLLGWYLASSPKLPNRTVCIALTAAGIAATTLLTWLMTRRSGELNAVFYQYFMPNVLITAVGIFGLFRRTFGVYLCLMLFFRLLEPAFAALPLPAAVTMLLLTAAVWLLSVLFSILLRQIPVVRFITLGERFRS